MFSSNFNKKGLVVSLVLKFWGHDGPYESNHFLKQRRRMMMITTLTSTGNKTMKVKRSMEGGFCVIFWGFYFLVGPFFSIRFCQPDKVFYHQESGYYIQIKHNRRFLPQFFFFAVVLVFLNICHNFREITNEIKIKIKECVASLIT
jgi:hypothetical protein